MILITFFSISENLARLRLLKNETDTSEEVRKFRDYLNFISPSVNLNYKLSPLLKYKYPPPNKLIIKNIAHALLRHQMFYIQVLHLMNKLNLMPPFEKPYLNSSEFDHIYSESEYESESEGQLASHEHIVNIFKHKKRKLKVGLLNLKKRKLNIERLTKPIEKKSIKKDDIFETTQINSKGIKIQIECQDLNHSSFDSNQECQASTHGFGLIQSFKHSDTEEKCIEEDVIIDFIDQEELKAGLVEKQEWPKYSVLKNYSPGTPSSRLYIKNLAKSVKAEDLKRIFGRYVDWKINLDKNM